MATKTIAYLRVSTDKQADHGVSLEAQEEKAKMYAKLYDLELVEIIIDAGESAKSLERSGLQRALKMLKNKEAEALLVVKLDRLTRSVRDLGTLIDDYFGNKSGIALLCVAEQVDTRSAGGRLVLNVLMSVAQWEREAIGERTSVALRHKASKNEYTGGNTPYGWMVSGNGVDLVPVKKEQQNIEIANKLKAKGKSLRAIGNKLYKSGRTSRSGTQWYPSSVKAMLNAKVYAAEC